jgi:hypothetical protein
VASKKKVDDYLILGHLIKYNLYLLSKSVIFSSILNQSKDIEKAISLTNQTMDELDLDTKARKEQEKAKE